MTGAEFPFAFECARCGNCCTRPEGRVRVTTDEVAALARARGLAESGFVSRYLNAGPNGDWLVRLAPDGACPFLERADGLALCTVYGARPEHCRTFPFWDELRTPGPALDEARRFCAGIRPRGSDPFPISPRRL